MSRHLRHCPVHGVYAGDSGCRHCRYSKYLADSRIKELERQAEPTPPSPGGGGLSGFRVVCTDLGIAIGALSGAVYGLIKGYKSGGVAGALI
jgi:hypothetical protein